MGTSPDSRATVFSGAWNKFSRACSQQGTLGSADATEATDSTPEASSPKKGGRLNFGAAQKAAQSERSEAKEGKRTAAQASSPSYGSLTPSIADRCFGACSYLALLVLPLFLLATFAAHLHNQAFWLLPQETHFVANYELMRSSGQWLMPSVPLAPAWFWCMGLLSKLPQLAGQWQLMAASALFGTLALLGAYFLARSTGFDRREGFAAGLVLLSCLFFPFAVHRTGPESLFTACLLFSLACLYRGWSKNLAPLWLALGYLFMALAVLTNGLLGLVPLLASLLFLLFRGKFYRFNKLDGVLGFALLLLTLLGWVGVVLFWGSPTLPLREFWTQGAQAFLPPYWPPIDPVWTSALVLALALLPWLPALFFLSRGKKQKNSQQTEQPATGGLTWISLNLLLGLGLLTLTSEKFCLDLAPFVALLALLLGKIIARLDPTRSRVFFLLTSLLYLLAGLALGLAALAQFWPPLQGMLPLPWPANFAAIKGLPVLAGILLLAGLVVWKVVDRRFATGSLLICSIFSLAFTLSALALTTGSLQGLLAAPAVAQEKSAPAQTPAKAPVALESPKPAATEKAPATPEKAAESAAPTTEKAAEKAPAATEKAAESATPEAEKANEKAPAAPEKTAESAAPTAEKAAEQAPATPEKAAESAAPATEKAAEKAAEKTPAAP